MRGGRPASGRTRAPARTQQHGRLVGPAARHVLDLVATAPDHQHGHAELHHELVAGRVALRGGVCASWKLECKESSTEGRGRDCAVASSDSGAQASGNNSPGGPLKGGMPPRGLHAARRSVRASKKQHIQACAACTPARAAHLDGEVEAPQPVARQRVSACAGPSRGVYNVAWPLAITPGFSPATTEPKDGGMRARAYTLARAHIHVHACSGRAPLCRTTTAGG